MRKVIAITFSAFVAYLVLGWLLGSWLQLDSSRVWIFRIAIALIGVMAGAFVIWFFHQRETREKGLGQIGALKAGTDEIGGLLREASSHLPRSRGRFGSLPAVFVIGELKSAKTSIMVNSGIDPEPLAGQVFQDADVIPTRAANLWFGKGTIFVEAGGAFVDDADVWARIVRAVQPRGLGSAVSSKTTTPSSALVAVDVESLVRPGAAEQLAASARRLRARLIEISQNLGAQLPVYVLFTRADRIPFFAEFTRNMTEQEAGQVLGAALPVTPAQEGIYAQQEADRLTAEFEKLFRSLCAFRPAALAREFEAANLPGVYEFPRELRKIRPNLVQFLVDLCRPSQLTVGPFLRGFYFSGVRPRVITDLAAPVAAAERMREPASGATGLFRVVPGTPLSAAPVAPASRRVPQWIFLNTFFQYVLLGDRSAQTASGDSARTSRLRRVLLATACALCLLWSIALAVSFARNHALESRVHEAALGIRDVGKDGASLDSLRRLESLRQSLELVTVYHRKGAPLWFHWGLASVDEIYPHVRQIYFDNFHKLLLAPTQAALVSGMRSLPPTPGPEYGETYDSLKSYLITTTHPEKSTRTYLSPVLTSRWSADQQVQGERLSLARKQFDFYSDELKLGNPFSSDSDSAAVEKARQYLNRFAGLERVYAAMLADASRTTQPINFNKKFPGSAETVVDAYEVPGAFTKPGWDFMRASLKDPERYFSGEQWVLGDQGASAVDRGKLGAQLAARYYADFAKQWRAYLKSAAVAGYTSIRDASRKLNVIAGNQSTLLALFSIASQNTAVDVPEIANLFQPVQSVVPPGSVDRFIAPPNQPYMTAMLQLQTAVDTASQATELNDQVAQPTLMNASQAHVAAKQIAQAFRVDSDGRIDATVGKLMEDPITNVEKLLKRLGPEELNAKGREFCVPYRKLMAKYPFNSAASAPQTTVAEVNAVLHPGDGALWMFYETGLKKLLVKQGSQYAPVAGGAVALSPAFVRYFNDIAALSESWYAGGTPDPHFTYTIKPVPTEDIQNVGLEIDGQILNWSAGSAASKQFTWQAKDRNEVKPTVRLGGAEIEWGTRHGLWSLFQFFGEAENRHNTGDVETLEWAIRLFIGKEPVTTGGKTPTVRVELSTPGEPPVFQKGYFSRLACVAEVAK